MRRNFLFILIVALAGCIKEVQPDIEIVKPQLVAEGLLLTDSTPCKIILSYSGTVNFKGYQQQQFVNDATVTLHDDAGNNISLVDTGSGTYLQQNTSFFAKTGNSYYITIALADGRTYQSVPEKIIPVPQTFLVDSIGFAPAEPPAEGLYGGEVKISTQDPAGEVNYYRWLATTYVRREATGVSCGISCIEDQYCYQYIQSPDVYVLSDANINGNKIINQPVIVAPYYTFGPQYTQIKQLSLTKQAYQFWKLYIEQSSRTGTVLDPLPSPITGNIYNTKDSTDLALGYFEASDAVSKKIYVFPNFTDLVTVFQFKQDYIGAGRCYLINPNSQRFPPSADEWQNAQRFDVDVP